MTDESDAPPEPQSPCEAEKALLAQGGASKKSDGDAALGSLGGIRTQMLNYESTWVQYGAGNSLYLEIRSYRLNLDAQLAADGVAWADAKTAFDDAMTNLSCSATNWSFLLGVAWEKYAALQAKAAGLAWAVSYWSNCLNDWHDRAYPF